MHRINKITILQRDTPPPPVTMNDTSYMGQFITVQLTHAQYTGQLEVILRFK